LQNGIEIQMGQIQAIEIKETAEERRNGKSKSADKKRNISDGFVGVFCRNSDPTIDPPRIELLRRKNSDRNEMKKVGYRDNRHMVTCERQLTVGIDGGNDCDGRTRSFPLGRHLNLAGRRGGSNTAREQRRHGCKKARTRARKAEACDSAVHTGFFRARRHFQNVGMPCHHPAVISKKRACHIVTRPLFPKRPTRPILTQPLFLKTLMLPDFTRPLFPKRPAWPVITRLLPLKTPTSPSITWLLPLKRRRHHQSLGRYS
jgi:hypothetical protein